MIVVRRAQFCSRWFRRAGGNGKVNSIVDWEEEGVCALVGWGFVGCNEIVRTSDTTRTGFGELRFVTAVVDVFWSVFVGLAFELGTRAPQ